MRERLGPSAGKGLSRKDRFGLQTSAFEDGGGTLRSPEESGAERQGLTLPLRALMAGPADPRHQLRSVLVLRWLEEREVVAVEAMSLVAASLAALSGPVHAEAIELLRRCARRR